MVITEAGEVGVQCAPLPLIIFRPTLHAMSRIGEPAEIVQIAARMFGGGASILDAIRVLWACTEDDADAYTGFIAGDDAPAYTPGAMPVHDLLVIAAHLLEHGLIGKSKQKAHSQKSSANTEFVAADYVVLAIAHLGMSERAAWATTMTTLVAALQSKFPEIGKPTGPGANAPSPDELDADMEWLEQVNKLRGG